MTTPQRAGIGGALGLSAQQSPTIPAILDGDSADVALAANAAFIGSVNRPVRASFVGAPLANLGIVGAWISNGTTGVVTVRCSALTGNVASAAQALYVEILQ